MYNYCIITADGWLTATTSTIATMIIIMMMTIRTIAKKVMASEIIITIMEAMRIDHDNGVCDADTIVTHTTKTRCV